MSKHYEDLIPKKQAFVDAYLDSGDRDDAYLKAGYKPGKRSHRVNARALFLELQYVIKEEIDKRIGRGAVMALKIIREIMEDEKQTGTVRLQAAKDYLSRAGYDKPAESNLNINDMRDIKDDELQQEVDALLAKVVNAGPRA